MLLIMMMFMTFHTKILKLKETNQLIKYLN
jgi:hypothetical protein